MKAKAVILSFAVLLITASLPAQGVTLKQLGKANMLSSFVFGDYFNGNFYSIDTKGALTRTDLVTGNQFPVGNVTFKNTGFFFAYMGRLYSMEGDGSLTQIDPLTGAWTVVASMGSWTNISRVIVVGSSFFTIDAGTFYHHPVLNPRMRKQVGESEFYDMGMLFRTDSSLHSLIADGSLYEINISTGKWTRIGKSKTWKYATAGAVLNHKLYTAETPTALYETSLPDGTRKELDATQFKRIRLLFPDSDKLYMITKEGTLYEVGLGAQ